ncbi:MAG: streptogramin lyase [Variovorax sp.]|nr:streptogramin lyase [Variovorax sp.]
MRRLACLTLVSGLPFIIPALAQDFPDGPGKEVVTTTCNGCHEASRVRAGYSPEGWRTVMTMMRNMDAPVPAGEWPVIQAYLTRNFPEPPRPPAVTLEGPASASFRTWDVPTPGSRPHDPRAAQDGSIWYTGQLAGRLGRIDPASGAVKEFPLQDHPGPHGLAEDKDGRIWFTANRAGAIGRLDPRTGEAAYYPLPDPNIRDPHTLNFDQKGRLWFTAQQGNVIGRLIPSSGEIKLIPVPTADARPYGLMITSKGAPVVVEFGINKIATVDPETLAIREYTLPDAAARPRRLALGPDDVVWYTDFARGYLGRLDMTTGAVKEWPSPSGPKSQPYGIAFTRGAVWYSESFAKPNTLVRFDPAREVFQTWTIPGGGDIVRNMDVDRDGNLLLAHSLANRVSLVEVR